MTIHQGTRKCEYCGRKYDWCFREIEHGEVIVSTDEMNYYKNVSSIGNNGSRLIATSRCPYCGWMQMTNLVDEEIEVTSTQLYQVVVE